MRTTYLFIQEGKGEGDDRLPLRAQLKMAFSFVVQHNTHIQFIAYILAIIGCVMVLIPSALVDPVTFNTSTGWYKHPDREFAMK